MENRELLEDLVDEIGAILGVDTGTCSKTTFEAAVEAAKRVLEENNHG